MVLVEVVCGLVDAVLIEAIRVLGEALSTNIGFQIVVEAVKVHEEAMRMAKTAETV
jgi:hypothetical protein